MTQGHLHPSPSHTSLSPIEPIHDSPCFAKAWGALVESVRAGYSSTALAAVGSLLTSSKGWATKGDISEASLLILEHLPPHRRFVQTCTAHYYRCLRGSVHCPARGQQ